MKVLLVDDDGESLQAASATLTADGHEVTTCTKGSQALGATLREDFDVALVELQLPDIHGLEVVRALKMQVPGLSVVVTTREPVAGWQAETTEAGADVCVDKPLSPESLRRAIVRARGGLLLDVIAAVDDVAIVAALRAAGAVVRAVPSAGGALVALAERAPELVLIDAAIRDQHVVTAVCLRRRIACFVLADAGFDDAAALAEGVSFVAIKPVDPGAVVERARFVAAG
ncbi:MAG TPA: response regulator [Myxococcota bacterium]